MAGPWIFFSANCEPTTRPFATANSGPNSPNLPSNTPILLIGTVVAGRNSREIENLIGCFINFLPLRIHAPENATGRDILHRVRSTVTEAQDHQDCPFEKIVEQINPERKLNQNPLYNVALLLQDYTQNYFAAGATRSEPFPL